MRTFGIITFLLGFVPASMWGAIEIDRSDEAFFNAATKELTAIRDGKRGLVMQTLVERLDQATPNTKIRAVTTDESTWHPNDRKGTRSHLVPQDTKIQGAERKTPTAAIVYLHPSRVDSQLSLYKLGTFAYFLAMAADLNAGQFSSDYRVRERRATFFVNAWRDSFGYSMLATSDNVTTPDYQKAKQAGLLTDEQKPNFPILSE